MTVCNLDAVVERAKVSSRGDKVDVVIGVIILLELDRVKTVSR